MIHQEILVINIIKRKTKRYHQNKRTKNHRTDHADSANQGTGYFMNLPLFLGLVYQTDDLRNPC